MRVISFSTCLRSCLSATLVCTTVKPRQHIKISMTRKHKHKRCRIPSVSSKLARVSCNYKLSYRRDSARRRSLRRSRSLKVTDVGTSTNGKSVCYFLLMNIPTDILSCTVSKLLRITDQILHSTGGVPLFNTIVRGEPLNST